MARTAERMRCGADAYTDLGLLSPTAPGDALPAGPVGAFDRNGCLRVDGAPALGWIGQNRLPVPLSPVNPFDGRTADARRTGDVLHASSPAAPPGRRPRKLVVDASAVSAAARMALSGWDVQGTTP